MMMAESLLLAILTASQQLATKVASFGSTRPDPVPRWPTTTMADSYGFAQNH